MVDMVGYSNFHTDQIGSFLGPLYVCAMLGLTYVLVGAPPIFAQVIFALCRFKHLVLFAKQILTYVGQIHFFPSKVVFFDLYGKS